MRTKTFNPWRIVAIRNLDGAVRATPRTPQSCDGPRGLVSMRPLGLAGQRSLQAPVTSEERKHCENGTCKDPQNFDAQDRANARTHAQAETANRLLSPCFVGSNKENPAMS